MARRSALWPEGQSPHRSALTKARAKIPWQAFDPLLGHAVALAYEVVPPREEYLWQGLSVFACYGSKDSLPATEAVRQAFDPQGGLAYPGRGHYPQCLVMTAYDVLRRLPVGRTVWALQDGDERAQAQHLLPLLPPTSLSLLRLMQQHPHFIALQRQPGTAARVGRVWPGLGVKVELAADQPPRAVYERETFSTSEAITFYEFALESVIDARL